MWLLLVFLVDREIAHKFASAITALIVNIKAVTKLWEDVFKVNKGQTLPVLNLLIFLIKLLGPDFENSLVVDCVFPGVCSIILVRKESKAVIVSRHLLELTVM